MGCWCCWCCGLRCCGLFPLQAAKRQLFVRMEIDSRDDAYRWGLGAHVCTCGAHGWACSMCDELLGLLVSVCAWGARGMGLRCM